MKCTTFLISLFIAAFSNIALASINNCEKINNYLEAKGKHYNEGNGYNKFTELVNSCVMNSYGIVTKLDLNTYCLEEKDVNKILEFTKVETLILNSNNGYHSIGIEGLRSCGESDFFPSGISKLTNLKSLDLFGISVYKKGDIASLPKSVNKLSLSYKQIPQFVINEIGKLYKIEDLTLIESPENQLNKLDLSPLSNIRKITFTRDDHSSVHKKDYLDPSMFKKLSNVYSLAIELYVFNQKNFDTFIKYIPNVKELRLKSCGFDENVNIDSIKNLTKLETLKIYGVHRYCTEDYTVFDDQPCPLGKVSKSVYSMKSLKTLNLYNQNNPYVDLVGNLENLEYLNLGDTELTYIPKGVFSLKNLKYLNLSYNKLEQIPDQIENLKKLRTLNVYMNYDLRSIPVSVCKINYFNYSHTNSTLYKICHGETTMTMTSRSYTSTRTRTTRKSTTTKTLFKTTKKSTTITKNKTSKKGPTSTAGPRLQL